jgi:hypothetical protein
MRPTDKEDSMSIVRTTLATALAVVLFAALAALALAGPPGNPAGCGQGPPSGQYAGPPVDPPGNQYGPPNGCPPQSPGGQ